MLPRTKLPRTLTTPSFDAKRLIGRKFSDAEVQTDAKHFPFEVIDKAGKPYIKVQYRGEPKEFVSCDVIRKISAFSQFPF